MEDVNAAYNIIHLSRIIQELTLTFCWLQNIIIILGNVLNNIKILRLLKHMLRLKYSSCSSDVFLLKGSN